MPAKVSDKEFWDAYKRNQSPTAMSLMLGLSTRNIISRLRRNGVAPLPLSAEARAHSMTSVGRVSTVLENGKIVIFSDAHYWPGYISTAHRALIQVIKTEKPAIVVCNGDAFDGAQISRFGRNQWSKAPTVVEELKAVKERLGEVEKAAKGAKLFWPFGNHDSRFETALSNKVSEFEGVEGFHLKDHFPLWSPCWSLFINDDIVIKHRIRGGVHATRNNTLAAGRTTVTGHLHQLKVTPFADYNGNRYGIDCGTLADPYGPQFQYAEDNPQDWRSGFIVLSIRDGSLLHPLIAQVRSEGEVEYKGEIIQV
jgi:predicted phosphodiesterase